MSRCWSYFVRSVFLALLMLATPTEARHIGNEALALDAGVRGTPVILDVHYGDRDGVQLWAKIQLPSGYNPALPTPLLIVLHCWSDNRAQAAANALAEYAPGAEARGWLLAAPLLNGYTASRFVQQDIIALVRYMSDVYRADPRRIYLTGKSMGGMIAATTAARYPDVFAAVVEEHGPTVLADWYRETTDWRRERIRQEVGATPEQSPFEYQRRSAASMAQNLKHVPFAIIHGLYDEVVPVHHARTLYEDMILHGPDHLELHLFPGQHGELFPGDDTMAAGTEGILDFLGRYTLYETPSDLSIRTDGTYEYYWLQIVQDRPWSGRWTRATASFDTSRQTIEASVYDEKGLPVSLSFDLVKMGLALQDYIVERYNQDTGDYRWERISASSGRIALDFEAGHHQITIRPWDGRTPTTLTLRQGAGGYLGATDAYIHQWHPDQNFGNRGELGVRAGTVSSLLRFDLASLPRGTVVKTAQLRLYAQYGADGIQVALYPLLRPWVDSEVTWNQARSGDPWAAPGATGAGDRAATPYSAVTVGNTGEWYALNVRDLVEAWIENPERNYGVLLEGIGPNLYQFASSDCSWDAGVRPELRLVVLLPPATVTPTPRATASPTTTPTPTATLSATPSPTGTLPTMSPTPTTTATFTPTATPALPIGIIYGLVWEDADGDGQIGALERPLAGILVELRDTENRLLIYQRTSSNGRYAFTNLSPAVYLVRLPSLSGYEPTTTPAWVGWVTAGALREVNFGVRCVATPAATMPTRIYLPLIVKG